MKKNEASMLGPLAVGLLILFAIISSVVLACPPQTVFSEEHLLAAHCSGLYFIEAELLAKQVHNEASARWSHFVIDPGGICAPAGNGVWYAKGTVDITRESQPTTIVWEVLFSPGSQIPLCAHVGDFQAGDLKTALHVAGRDTPANIGAAREK